MSSAMNSWAESRLTEFYNFRSDLSHPTPPRRGGGDVRQQST
jgi:hypothetical protein